MESILIANRAEIAIRVIRAAREAGMRTIAVYSELDRDARHAVLADEAWNIGPAPAAESYLNIERLLEVAAAAGADAVHPGYGFLAENPEFARAVGDAGLIWVGPPAAAIAIMGDKIESRRTAARAGVAAVPGTTEPLTGLEAVTSAAAEYGYPIAIKAAHGGGGRGLKIVRGADELENALESARREADAYFGNPEVYVEKYLERPRHIEAQIVFDHHGNGLFLGERDCSVQRRHQKLIEEAPSPVVSPELRAALGDAALAVAAVADYASAGTVEFLVTPDGEFYFLEMNTRIQVEHTITEAVTGIDLVGLQLRIAAGEALSLFPQPQINGHAIEFRINAEDPAQNFLPTTGQIVEYREPGGFGVRVDAGYAAGSAISQYYDNLVAKLVVWGRDRAEAIARGERALREFHITGIPTTIPAHLAVLDHPDFVAGDYHTRFVEDDLDMSGLSAPVAATLPGEEEMIEREMTAEVGGRRYVVRLWTPAVIQAPGAQPVPRRRPPRLDREAVAGSDAGIVAAPMQGTIVKVHKKAGDHVEADDPLCVLEAMKMENEIRSPVAGEVVDLRVQAGDTVSGGAVLMVIK